MELRHIRYFLAVAEELNFNRAAARLHISQPPLTRQIQQLEADLGVELFIRGPKGVELTNAGRTFRDEAMRLVSLVDRAADRTRLAGEGRLGRLDVGIFGSAVLNVIPRMVLAFRRLYPDVRIELHNMDKLEQIEALRDGRITLGFNRILPPTPDIVVETVLNERLIVAINRNHPYTAKREIAIADLADQPQILFPSKPRPSFADQVQAMCQNNGFKPRIANEVGDAVTAAALVSSGFGLCVMPESAISLQLPQILYRKLEWPHPTIALDCLYLRGNPSPILPAFLEIVRGFRSDDAHR